MPGGQKPSKAALAGLRRLERHPDLTIEGGKLPLGLYIREDKQTVQPEVALWVESRTNYVLGVSVINPQKTSDQGISEALASLVEAVTAPVSPQTAEPSPAIVLPEGITPLPSRALHLPQLPSKILVNDAALAEAVRAVFEPLGVTVTHTEYLPAFEYAFEEMASAIGAEPDAEPPEPFSWEVDPALLPDLFAAAAGYARRAPWRYMPDNPPLAIALGDDGPADGVQTLYGSVMGAAEQVYGLACYYSLNAFREILRRGAERLTEVDDEEVEAAMDLLRTMGAPVDSLPREEVHDLVANLIATADAELGEEPEPQEDCLVLFFAPREEHDLTYLEWLEEHNLQVSRRNVPSFLRTAPDADPRSLDDREVKALTKTLKALDRFFARFHQTLEGPVLPADGLVLSQAPGVAEVRFPAPGFAWDEAVW